eukprot:1255603-Amphidinium_carterae.2
MLLSVVFGMRLEPIVLLLLETFMCDAKKWRTSRTSFSAARTGTRNVAKLSYRRMMHTPWRDKLHGLLEGSYMRHGYRPFSRMNRRCLPCRRWYHLDGWFRKTQQRPAASLLWGRRIPKGLNKDLDKRALNAYFPGQRIRWMNAHQTQGAVNRGTIVAVALHGNGQADSHADQRTAAHGPLEPDATWTRWADFANKVYHFLRFVGPQLRERPEAEPKVTGHARRGGT